MAQIPIFSRTSFVAVDGLNRNSELYQRFAPEEEASRASRGFKLPFHEVPKDVGDFEPRAARVAGTWPNQSPPELNAQLLCGLAQKGAWSIA